MLFNVLIALLTANSGHGHSPQCETGIQPPPYVLESSAMFSGNIPVKKYVTTKTGITIFIANTGGSVVNGYLCLATKAHDDNGLPHCLEHLTFTGSDDYPYNGAFFPIAIRCSAISFNAFTDVDRTCYTSSHLGKDGFLNLLPIFMNHILHPTLKASAFLTEVYHVSGDGSDGGVLYSEMEAHPYEYTRFAFLKALYKDYGFGSNVGGGLKNLRENTTRQMTVAYHDKFYRPENLCITICGDVTIDDVMTSIKKIEAKIHSKPKLPKWERPWIAKLPVMETSVVETLVPSNSDGDAEIYIVWRGPNCATEYRKSLACRILLSYLSSSSVAGDTFAKGISSDTIDKSKIALFFKFADVPVNKTSLVYPKLHTRLQNISQGIEKIDLTKIKAIINEKLLSLWNDLESSPQDTISNLVANHFLYGSSTNDFKTILNGEEDLNYLLTVSDSYWIGLLNEYFIDKKYIQSTGIPSVSELNRLNQEDAERIRKRIETLGPDGLKRKGDELELAIAANTLPVPDSVINSVPIANISDVEFQDVQIYRTNGINDGVPSGLNLNSWPIYAEAYDCRTKFVYITVTFSTNQIAAALRPYLYLVLKLIRDLPIQHVDPEVVALNNFKTITTDYRIGLTYPRKAFSCGLFSQTATFTIQVQRSEYEVGVKYLIARLQNTVFTANSIRDAAHSLLYYVTDPGTDVTNVALDLLRTMYYKTDTNTKSFSVIYQNSFLTSLITKLDAGAEAPQILENMNNLRNILVSPENLAVHVTSDFTAMSKTNVDLNGPWQRFGFNGSGPKTLKVVMDWEVMVAPSTVSSQGEVVGLTSTDSGNVVHSSPAMTDYNDKDLAPLTVALSYCSQIGGPMWSRVRGPGYTYFYVLELILDEGVIQLQLLLATNIARAFNETFNIVNELIQPNAVWDVNLFDSAKRSAVFDVVNRMQKLSDVPLQSLLLSFQKVSPDYNKVLISEINAVTIDDVKRVAQLYLKRIFSTTESKTAIVCHINDAPGISQDLKTLGFNLPVRASWADSLLGQF